MVRDYRSMVETVPRVPRAFVNADSAFAWLVADEAGPANMVCGINLE